MKFIDKEAFISRKIYGNSTIWVKNKVQVQTQHNTNSNGWEW